MTDLNQALANISAMRRQMAQGTIFRGYGPAALATTGVLAIAGAWVQHAWIVAPLHDIGTYLFLWTVVATVSALIVAVEAIRRSTREHCGLADDMLKAAAEQFLPAALAGVLLTVVIAARVPQALWMLPALWQIVLSLGMAAACASLPRPMIAVSLWYLGCGLACLVYADGDWALSPWAMAIPFGGGQVLSALLLKLCFGDHHVRP